VSKKGLKHGAVIEMKRARGDISDSPAMEKLTRLYEDMTEEEQARTLDYLKALPPGKSEGMPGENRKKRRTGHGEGTETDHGIGHAG
jgi:hypothetical protein